MASDSIGKASGEGVISLGTQAWNIADGYTKIKILRLLIELDLQETIAMFGRKDTEEMVDPMIISQRRVEGLNRMLFYLRQLIGNCKFSIETRDKRSVTIIMERLESVEKVITGIAKVLSNEITKEEILVINEDHFRNCFNILRDIKDEMNVPINRAGLIFRKTDEIDLDSLMKNVMEGH